MVDKLDVIIFGATGFTGKIVVEKAEEVLQGLTWGNMQEEICKLENVLSTVGKKTGKDLSQVSITLADVEDEKAIKEMANKCKIVVNCCGPYRFYGEIVVKACIEAGTHHVDISAEPQFIEGMMVNYHDLAKEKHAYVISACGFDSIPGEMGVVFAERNFPGTVNSIESYWENTVDFKDKNCKTLVHTGTWASLIHVFGNTGELIAIREKLTPKDLPRLEPKLKVRSYPHKEFSLDSYFVPIQAGDRDLVVQTQNFRFKNEKKRPIQYENYIGFKSVFVTLFAPLLLAIFSILARCSLTRKVLMMFPNFFTFGILTEEGPTEDNMERQSFEMVFKTKGWTKDQLLSEEPKQQLWTRISARNPFYAMTAVAMLSSAKIILQETDKLPGSGGVISPGYAFLKTSLIEELQKYKYGMRFEILKLEQI
ncbi:saccharopine dehydrogenase-like oxidoreductase [Zeugodacus cucurbitae]|uniref:saccharopine dehydrogenase-like oxidoreductase n=1 Tax=Zeugodacus cucurbitae TaxID=28588 RepID=UPI0023D8F1AC|nr:saccharopine dehydrogenase-like oxidoreductase [Zeugodacus cucurbitae]